MSQLLYSNRCFLKWFELFMDAWLQSSDFKTVEYTGIEKRIVIDLYLNHDWKMELDQEELLAEDGCPAGIGLTTKNGGLLQIMPDVDTLNTNTVYLLTYKKKFLFFKKAIELIVEDQSKESVIRYIESQYEREYIR